MTRRSHRIVIASFVALLALGRESGVRAAAVPAASMMPASNSAPVSFEFRRGHMVVPVLTESNERYWFMLDTGYTLTMASRSFLDGHGLEPSGSVTIAGIAGNEETATYRGVALRIGESSYRPRRIAAFPGSGSGRSKLRDGILGAGFFRRFVVEIDSQARKVRLHDPAAFEYRGAGEVLKLEFNHSTPVIEAGFAAPNGNNARARFEIDTGCTGGLCLGREFADRHGLLPEDDAGRNGARRGVGGSARVREGHLPELRLGALQIARPPANFFLDGSPSDAGFAGHIGLEVLRRYKVIFDYSRRRLILEP